MFYFKKIVFIFIIFNSIFSTNNEIYSPISNSSFNNSFNNIENRPTSPIPNEIYYPNSISIYINSSNSDLSSNDSSDSDLSSNDSSDFDLSSDNYFNNIENRPIKSSSEEFFQAPLNFFFDSNLNRYNLYLYKEFNKFITEYIHNYYNNMWIKGEIELRLKTFNFFFTNITNHSDTKKLILELIIYQNFLNNTNKFIDIHRIIFAYDITTKVTSLYKECIDDNELLNLFISRDNWIDNYLEKNFIIQLTENNILITYNPSISHHY